MKESKTYFREFDKSNGRRDEFFMRYMGDTVRFKNFALIVKIVFILSHGQMWSVENMQEQKLITQRVTKAHLYLTSGHLPYNFSITRDLHYVKSVRIWSYSGPYSSVIGPE